VKVEGGRGGVGRGKRGRGMGVREEVMCPLFEKKGSPG